MQIKPELASYVLGHFSWGGWVGKSVEKPLSRFKFELKLFSQILTYTASYIKNVLELAKLPYQGALGREVEW